MWTNNYLSIPGLAFPELNPCSTITSQREHVGPNQERYMVFQRVIPLGADALTHSLAAGCTLTTDAWHIFVTAFRFTTMGKQSLGFEPCPGHNVRPADR